MSPKKTMKSNGWTRKFKGSPTKGGAWIWVHPSTSRAIVENAYGVSYDGEIFGNLLEAAEYALRYTPNPMIL